METPVARVAAGRKRQLRRITTKTSIESIVMLRATAMPYAPASALELRNVTTSRMTAANSIQLSLPPPGEMGLKP